MTQTRSCYLAGPITGLSYDAARFGWRAKFRELINARAPHIECFSPMRAKEFLQGQESLACDAATLTNSANVLAKPNGILTRDYNDVKNRDAIVACFLDHAPGVVSIGTVWEVGAAYAHHKPVVMVMKPGDIHDHIFLTHTAGYVVETLDEASLILASLLTPDL